MTMDWFWNVCDGLNFMNRSSWICRRLRNLKQIARDKEFRQRAKIRMRDTWRMFLVRSHRHPLSIVCGADFTHAKSLIQLVNSILRYEPKAKLYIYDLGLTFQQRQQIEQMAPHAVIRTFDYSRYPEWFNIRIEAGQYAWKPVIIEEVVNESYGPVVWMDAGNILTTSIGQIYFLTMRDGVYSPSSDGDLEKWTHELTLAYFGLNKEWARGKRNVNGACVAFSPLHKAGAALCREWSRYAQVREAIAPLGASRKNHRQDQALLGVLAHRAGLVGNRDEFYVRFQTQCDID